MEIKPDMYWIGSLQDIGKNYADLYFDKVEQKLYLFILLPEQSHQPHYAMISVSPEQIKEYMAGEKKIGEIFSNHPYKLAIIKDREVGIEETGLLSTPEIFQYDVPFDSEVSRNGSNINLVVRRLMKGRAI